MFKLPFSRNGFPFGAFRMHSLSREMIAKCLLAALAGGLLVPASVHAGGMEKGSSGQSYEQMHAKHHAPGSDTGSGSGSGMGHHGHHDGAYDGHGHHDGNYMGHDGEGAGEKPAMHARHKHDHVNMPGLQGVDTTDVEISDLKTIFINHRDIDRRVENLPNGIRTVTESDDEDLRESIITHVAFMVTRLEEGRNPQVMIQSPTLDLLFDRYDEINTVIEMTDLGIEVTQTSDNPEVIALLQQHADEVSDMAQRGMQAVHERMMKTN